jgi:predicted nucleotidyltransferase
MIREGRRLPQNILDKMPEVINRISGDDAVVALFVFGSAAKAQLKPLSDLDFGILLSTRMNKTKRFEKQLELIGVFNDTFGTDEIDLVIMNDAPIRFSYNIISKGRLLFCRDRANVVDFVERIVKIYLDFKWFRDEFDHAFLKGVGYRG